MSDKFNLPDGFVPIDNPFPNIDVSNLSKFQPDISYLNKKVDKNLSHIVPFEDRIKPITDRQDKTIETLKEQIIPIAIPISTSLSILSIIY